MLTWIPVIWGKGAPHWASGVEGRPANPLLCDFCPFQAAVDGPTDKKEE